MGLKEKAREGEREDERERWVGEEPDGTSTTFSSTQNYINNKIWVLFFLN